MLNRNDFERIKNYSSKHYMIFYILQIVIYSFLLIFLTLTLPPEIEKIKRMVYCNQNEIFLPYSSTLVMVLPTLFILIVIIGLLLGLTTRINKNYHQYYLFLNLKILFKNKNLSQVHYDKYKKKYIKKNLLIIIIILTINVVCFIFSFDFYLKINKDYFIENSFFSFGETKKTLKDIKEVKIYTKKEKYKSNWDLNPYFEITFNNGDKYNIWAGGGWGAPEKDDLLGVINLLLNETTLDIKYIRIPEENLYLIDKYNKKRSESMKTIFKYLDSENKRFEKVH